MLLRLHANDGAVWRTTLLSDVRYAWRSFGRTPGNTLVLILTLALGIGSATAVFSVVDRILFRSLPYPDSERLVSVGFGAPIIPNDFHLGAEYFAWKESQNALSSLTFWGQARDCDISERNPLRALCASVEWNFLETFGVPVLAGRSFTVGDDGPGKPPVAILAHHLWRTQFGADPDVVGRAIDVDGRSTEVIGVLPESFELPTLDDFDLLVPEGIDASTPSQLRPNSGRVIRAFGRLAPGISIAQAKTLLAPLFEETLEYVPEQFRSEVSLVVRPLRERQVGDVMAASWMLLGATGLVLLISCANVANLLLARAGRRRQEIAVRAAVGAGRGRLAAQLLTEGIFIALVSCAAGVALAFGLVGAFREIAPAGIPRLLDAAIDFRVMGFALAVSIIASLIFAAAPALQLRGRLMPDRRTIGASRGLLRTGLVVGQIAMSLALVSGAGLLVESLRNLQNQSLGFQGDRLITANVVLSSHGYPTVPSRLEFYREFEQRLLRLPGVDSLALADTVPPSGTIHSRPFATLHVEGEPPFTEGTGGMVFWRAVSSDYFRTMGIPLTAGRVFDERDRTADSRSVIVSEKLAGRLFGPSEAAGRGLRFTSEEMPLYTVIGVASDVKNAGLDADPSPEFYLSRRRSMPAGPLPGMRGETERAVSAVVRTSISETTMTQAIRAEVAAIDSSLPVEVGSIESSVRRLAARPRFNALLLTFFALSSLVISAIGLYGVISFLVAERTSEIGVRMALGATSGRIAGSVLKRAVSWTLSGLVLGLVASTWLETWVSAQLFGVSADNVQIRVISSAVLLCCALLAAWIPSRRASRMDPLVALRHD